MFQLLFMSIFPESRTISSAVILEGALGHGRSQPIDVLPLYWILVLGPLLC